MKKILFIILLLGSMAASGQGNFFWSHNSGEAGGCRPMDMIDKSIFSATIISGITYTSSATEADAREAWYIHHYVAGETTIGNTHQAKNWTVGDSVYYLSSTSCEKVADGYYNVFGDYLHGQTIYNDSIYHISGGVLVAKTSPLVVGASMGGGILAYVYQSTDPGYDSYTPHGLIALNKDATEYPYSCTFKWGLDTTTIISAYGTDIGGGIVNTNDIVSAWGAGTYAIKCVYDLSVNGAYSVPYSDWAVPDSIEIVKVRDSGLLYSINYATSSIYNGSIVYLRNKYHYEYTISNWNYSINTNNGAIRPIRYF